MKKVAFRLASLVLACSAPLLSQFDTGTVLGTVVDASHSPLASATVVIEEVRKGVTLKGRSSDAGSFEFLSIPIGRYKLRVEQAGFRTQASQEFELTIGARQRVDFKLELNSVQSTVQVTADVSMLCGGPQKLDTKMVIA